MLLQSIWEFATSLCMNYTLYFQELGSLDFRDHLVIVTPSFPVTMAPLEQ